MFFSDYFIVYSEFAKNQFVKEYGNKKNLVQLSLVPYLFYSKLNPNKIELKKNSQLITFLFFGRVSKYKGIPELIDSFLKLSALNPNLRLIIAGKGKIDATEIHNEKIEIRNYFIGVSEMYELFQITDVIVCPYRDATQSGVVMTANAFNIPTIVSNVGALPENTYYKELVYDTENENGLENTMLKFINSVESYGINKSNRSNLNESNSSTLITLYNRE
jgi:glycosyltransferase involved in cell wall biosynthesis